MDHAPVAQDPEKEDDWNAKRVLINDVCVRYVDDMEHLSVTIEGELPPSLVQSLATDIQSKLALMENSSCRIKWID